MTQHSPNGYDCFLNRYFGIDRTGFVQKKVLGITVYLPPTRPSTQLPTNITFSQVFLALLKLPIVLVILVVCFGLLGLCLVLLGALLGVL